MGTFWFVPFVHLVTDMSVRHDNRSVTMAGPNPLLHLKVQVAVGLVKRTGRKCLSLAFLPTQQGCTRPDHQINKYINTYVYT